MPLSAVASPPGWLEAMATRPGDRTLTPWAVTLRDSGAVVGFRGFWCARLRAPR